MAGAEDVGDINGTFGKAENIEGVNVVKGIEEIVGDKGVGSWDPPPDSEKLSFYACARGGH